MPTKTSVPVNFSDMSNTNITKIRSGAKWKGFGATTKYQCQTQNGYFADAGKTDDSSDSWDCFDNITYGNKVQIFPKKYNIAGMYKPFTNYQSGKGPNNGGIGFKDERADCLTSTKALNPGENLAYPGTGEPYGGNSNGNNIKRPDPNAFRARPIKHYRLQYGNDNNKQTYNNRYLLRAFNKPGGTILKSYNGMIPTTVTYTVSTDDNGNENLQKIKIDQAWTENQAAYNVIKYGKDRDLYMFPTTECDGDDSNWEKLLEAGLSSDDIVRYGLHKSSLYNGQTDDNKALMKGLGSSIRAYPDYTLGKFNKVGKFNPIYFSTNSTSRSNIELVTENYTPNATWACENCPNTQCSNGKKGPICASGNRVCVNICDPPTKARQRVRTSSRINNPALCQRPYYFSRSSYLRARCRTFKQNQFQYDTKIDPSIGLPDPNAPCSSDNKNGCCGRSAACSRAYRANCPSGKNLTDCRGNIIGCQKPTYYKPNNCQFAQQGGVSSSSRLLRLKLNTINSSANSVNEAYGESTASALAYSGRPQAPFVNKDKMNAGGYIKKTDYVWVLPITDATTGTIIRYDPSYEGAPGARKVLSKLPCDNNLYFLYRPGGGNPVTSVMNGPGQGGAMTQRIIGRFNSTSEYPNFNQDSDSSPQRFWFMSRQDKTVDRVRERNAKVIL